MNVKNIVTVAAVALVVMAATYFLVGDNQPGVGGTRFPSGLSADGTSPSAGEIRGTTLTVTGASALSGALSTGDLNYSESTETIAADDTLTAAESGKVVFIGTAGVDLTLPLAAASEGITYRVVVSDNFATTAMTVTGGAADATDDLMYGVLDVAGAVVLCAAEDTITFAHAAELPGDYVDFHSDGVKWFVSGQAGATGGITCTDAD